VRRSHENPYIKELYARYFGSFNSELAHEKLHTHYVPGGTEADK
jgi:NADP-reducing hydrogenase subunit HndD